MNDQRLADTVRRALGNIIDDAPAPAPWPLQASAQPPVSTRWMVPVAALALGAIGAGAVVWVAGRDEPGASEVPMSPATTAIPTTEAPSTEPSAEYVGGSPVCGTQLPIIVDVSRSSGPLPGPAGGVGIEQAPGQYVEHWDFSEGSLEFRWPADEGDFNNDGPLPLDVTTEFSDGVGDEGVYFVGLTLRELDDADGTPNVVVPASGGSVDGGNFGLDPAARYLTVIGWTPTDAAVQLAPCDVVQMRFVDVTGAWSMIGLPLRELRTNEWWFPLDLYARVSATSASGDAAEPPVPFSSPDCPMSDHQPFGLQPVSEPIDALDALLASHDGRRLPQSAYEERYDSAEDRYFYVNRVDYDEDMIAVVITVERAEAGWMATRWQTTCG